MAVPFTQRATEAIYNHSKELADLISENSAIIGVLGARGRIEIITGGLGWRERVYYGTDPNAGHRDRSTQIPTAKLENMTMASFDPAFFSTSIVINHIDKAEVQGDAALGDLVKDSWEVTKAYAVQKIANDLWATSQVSSNYPIPLRIMIPETATASQTGTARGGISSTDNSWWRSQYYATTIADLGAAAGLRILQQEINKCSRSSAKISQPDFALTTSNLYSRIASTMDANRRFIKDDSILKLGFEHISFLNMVVLWDALCPSGNFYILNTRHLKVKCLKTDFMQNINVNEKQYSLPMSISPFVEDIDSWNTVSKMGLSYQLVCNDLQSLDVLGDCTE